jgi:hypothetical protein
VIDGDTVVVAGTRIRLKGVDAAELGTARAKAAKLRYVEVLAGPADIQALGVTDLAAVVVSIIPQLHQRLEQQLGHNMAPTPESVTPPPPYSWI